MVSSVRVIQVEWRNIAIGDWTFYCCYGLRNLALPHTLTALGKSVFAGCKSMNRLFVPASVTEIGADCFTKCRKLTLKVTAGSYAEQYAKEHNIRFTAE